MMLPNTLQSNKKPKGWRDIVVDNVSYWWCKTRYGGAPYIKRVSDKKLIHTWDHLVLKGWYEGMEKNEIRFTPKVIADIIRELDWNA